MDCPKRRVWRQGHELFLSATEFSLMELFLRHPGEPLSKTKILSEVWHDEGYRAENLVELYVNYLRKKTESFGMERVIFTVRKKGYVLSSHEV